jgi:hypothetical protein
MRSSVIACIVLVALTCALRAQPTVSFEPTNQSLQGISVIPPGDASFLPAVNSLVPQSVMSTIQSMLPYSLVLRNDTSRKIVAACVYFRVVGQNGGAGGNAECYGDFPPRRVLLAPGDAMLAMPGWSASPRDPAQRHDLSNRASYYAAAQSVSISLDSAIFGTGKLVGPDQLDNFDHYSAKAAARIAVGKAVVGLQGQDAMLQQYLVNGASGLRAALRSNASRTYQGEFSVQVAQDAQQLETLLESSGSQAVYSAGHRWVESAPPVTLHK